VRSLRWLPGTASRAAAFAAQRGIPESHPTYEALLDSPRVDTVYVAATNELHYRIVLEAIAARLPALCEKPFTLSFSQAVEMVSSARRSGVFLMEAMWMRFRPFVA
jgi:predicted dehydrogenase